MYLSLTTVHEQETKGTFLLILLTIKSEAEFLISSGTFFQSGLSLYAILSRPNFFVLGF